MSFTNFKPQTYLCALLLLSGCAAGVTHTPAEIAPAAAAEQRRLVTVGQQIELRLDTGYTRVLKAGSQWQRVGSIAQGEVYKPHQDIFTLEGTHVHEAYLVIANDRLAGFYLPVEHGFSPLKQQISLTLSSTPQ